MLAKRKMSVTELTGKVGITMAIISILKNGNAKAIRLSTLEANCSVGLPAGRYFGIPTIEKGESRPECDRLPCKNGPSAA